MTNANLRRSRCFICARRCQPSAKIFRVKSKVVFNERRDEEIAVVIAVPQSQIEGDSEISTRLPQQLRLELGLQERIAGSLIDKYWRTFPAPIFNQRRRIIFAPARAVVAQITGQRLLAPWTTDRRCDRSEG